ncbi:MAG: BamA/OMP85 family outer membrane protein, partial [Vicinamibacteria bacterium]
RELAISEGELYSRSGVEYSKARVNALGYFEEVNFNTTGNSEPGLLTLDIDVVERPTGAFSFGAGFSSVDRFLFSTQVQQANLFGKGQSLSVAADLGGRRQSLNFRFTDPYFFDSPWTFGVNGFFDEREFDDFTRKGAGGGFILGYPIADYSRVFGSYNLERQSLAEVDDFASAPLLRETERGAGVTSAVAGSAVRDTRNNRLTPSAGTIHSGSMEFAGLGGNNIFLRLEGRATWYFPLKGRFLPFDSVLAANARAGYILPFMDVSDFGVPSTGANVSFGVGDRVGSDIPSFVLGDIDSDLTVPVTHRYFLGGINSVRGYRARSLGPRRAILFQRSDGTYSPLDVDGNGKIDVDETNVVGGNKYLSFNFEYQFPIYKRAGLQGIAFLDGGQAFAENEAWDLDAIRVAYG